MRESIDYSAFEQNVRHLTDFPPKALDTELHRHFRSVHFDINAAFIVRAGFFSFSEAVRAGFLLLLNIQITLSEKIGIENRANYYDKAGALRDMVQSHILQIAAQLAMDQPVTFSDEDIRVEKVKALHALRIYKDYEVNKYFVRGQYAANNGYKAYRDEKNIPVNSNTNTFVAGKLLFDNNRIIQMKGNFLRIQIEPYTNY